MAGSDTATPRGDLRDAFADALVELGHERSDLIVLDADLNTSSKTDRFLHAFPDRFVQVGIAEQDLFGIAAGLALEGFVAVPSTFAAFAARRALDQIAISIAYPGLNVKIPGAYVGLPTSRAGASHNSIEDVAVFRAMPNMRVADPADSVEVRAVVRAAMETSGPVYFRVTRLSVPDLFGRDHGFEWGKGVVLREGRDVTLFGTGVMTRLCLGAADRLAGDGIVAEVVHLASIKPLDSHLVRDSVGRTGCAVTAENASVIGGFGGAILEALEEAPAPVQRIGVLDRWVDSGAIGELFVEHHMLPADIAAAARRAMELRDKGTAARQPGSKSARDASARELSRRR